MKKLMFLLLLLPSASFGQCTTIKDPFTGTVTKAALITLVPGLYNPAIPMILLSRRDTTACITFTFQGNFTKDQFDTEKMLLLVKFEDGTIRKFHADPVTTVAGSDGHLIVAFTGRLTPADVSYIRDFKMTNMRLSFKGDETFGYDNEIRPSVARKIMEGVACAE